MFSSFYLEGREICIYIQGDSCKKVNNFDGDSSSNFGGGKKVHKIMVLFSYC